MISSYELQTLKESKELISVYTDRENTDKFTVGRVLDFDSSHLLLWSVNSNGYYDGLAVRPIDGIFLWECKTKYMKTLEKLYTIRNPSALDFIWSGHDSAESLTTNLIAFAKNQHKVVSIQLCGSGWNDVTGYVEEVDDVKILMQELTDAGEKDGVCSLSLDSISRIDCDSQENMSIMLLEQSND